MSNELLDQFLNYIKFEKRLSELTIKNYQNDINRLLQVNDKKLTEFNSEDIRLSLSKLHASGLSGKSLSRILSSWRSCFLFLNKSQLMNMIQHQESKLRNHRRNCPKRFPLTSI